MDELTESISGLCIRKRVHFDSDQLDRHDRKRAIRRVGGVSKAFMDSKLREKQRMYELFGTESDESDDESDSEVEENIGLLVKNFGKIDIVPSD